MSSTQDNVGLRANTSNAIDSCSVKMDAKVEDEHEAAVNKNGDEQDEKNSVLSSSENPCDSNTKKRKSDEAASDTEETSNQQPLSKSQRKKLLKQQKYDEIKKNRKVKRKEKQQLKRQQRALEGDKVENTSTDEHVKKYRTMDCSEALSLKVAIDLSFDDLMSDKDINKLMKQVQRCYSLNRRVEHPVQLYLTSFGGKCKKRLDDLEGHYLNWDVHIKPERLADMFPKKEIVYLTSESPNVLKEIDMTKTYVIGGLVDHNHHKGLCYDMAVKKAIGHAQLPLGEFFKMTTRSVLTVNQVFEIIMFYLESKDWKDAFYKVMPQRKITPKVRRGKTKSDLNENNDKNDEKEDKELE